MGRKKRGGREKGSKGSKGQTVASRPEVGQERREQEPLVPPTPPFGTGALGAKPEAFGRGGGSFESARPKDKNQKGFGSSGTTEEKRVRVATKSYFPHNHPSYDGQKLLYNAKRLPVADDVVTGKVTIQTDRGKEQEFTIRIKLNGTVDLSPLHNLLQKKNIGEDEAYQCVAAVLRKAFSDSSANMEKRLDLTLNQNEEFLGTEIPQHSGKMSEDLVPAFDEDLNNCNLQNERAIHHHSSTSTMEGKKKTKSTMHKEDTALKSFFPQYFLTSNNLWSSELPLGTNIQEWRVIGVEVRREVVNSQIDVFIKMLRSLGATSGITFCHPEDTIYITNQETDLVSCYQKNKSLQLMVVVVPDRKDALFWQKRSLESAIHCLTAGTLFRMNEATVRNILQKIKAGRPWGPQPEPRHRPTRT
jgi:hypothetical protein